MSVEAMMMVTITGPQSMTDAALKSLVVNRQIHMENAITAMEKVRRLMPIDTQNPYAELLTRAKSIMEKTGIKPEYRSFDNLDHDEASAEKYLVSLSERLEKNRSAREKAAAELQSDAVLSQQLEHFSNIDVELKSLLELKYVKIRFGRLPDDGYDNLIRKINERGDVYYIDAGHTEHWIYGAYCTLPQESTRVDGIFTSAGFERIHLAITEDEDVTDTIAGTLKRIANESSGNKELISGLDKQYAELIAGEKEKFLTIWSWLKYVNEARELRANVGVRHDKFYIVGWVPKALSEAYAKECESYDGFGCSLSEPKGKKELSPPVKFKKGLLSSIYQPFVEMYGLPAYGEIDPRFFMALTYTLIFGVMFGDVGQGACLFLVGLLLWKLKGIWLARILSICGITSTIMGFVYGSVFGSENILDGFHVLEDGNAMKILVVAIGIGVVLLLVCMILNIITGIRQKDVKKIFFEPNGLAGFILYGGIAFAAVELLLFDKNLITAPYIICVVLIPLLAILGATPLTKLINGEKDWMPRSIGMFFVEGFFELFETLLSYVSNTISFLRVGAYTVSHAGMMMVVYLLSGGDSIFGIVLGNILITALEAALVCIQIMRLEFYEMFGRFYVGGGRKFAPTEIDYTAVG